MHTTYLARYMARVVKDEESGCWIYQTKTSAKRYPLVWYKGKNISAHILFYEHFKGPRKHPTSRRYCIEHICENYHCVNPDHLDEVTQGKNMQRAYKAHNDRRKAYLEQVQSQGT